MRAARFNKILLFRTLACAAAAFVCAANITSTAYATANSGSDPSYAPLTIQPPQRIVAQTAFLVGRGLLDRDGSALHDFAMPLPTDSDAEVRFIRGILLPRGGVQGFLDRLETVDTETPWSITTTVHIPVPLDSPLVPFMALAAENDTRADDFRRAGVGGGLQWLLGPNASIGAEWLYFGGSPGGDVDTFGREARFMTRLQITF